MTNCDSASKDEVACKNAWPSCVWKEGSDKVFKCLSTECNSLGITDCRSFLNFQKNKLTICNIVNGICTPTEASKLNSKCYEATLGYFTLKKNDCNQCVQVTSGGGGGTNTENKTPSSTSCLMLTALAVVTSLFA